MSTFQIADGLLNFDFVVIVGLFKTVRLSVFDHVNIEILNEGEDFCTILVKIFSFIVSIDLCPMMDTV